MKKWNEGDIASISANNFYFLCPYGMRCSAVKLNCTLVLTDPKVAQLSFLTVLSCSSTTVASCKKQQSFPAISARQRTSGVLTHSAKAVVLKVVNIDPHGSIGPSKGSINSHGVEWGHWIARGSVNNCCGLLEAWSTEASNSKSSLIGQGMQTAFFNKSNKITRTDQISATAV